MSEFTLKELREISYWAMEKADSAIRRQLRDTDFYEVPASIYKKANDEYYRRTQGQT